VSNAPSTLLYDQHARDHFALLPREQQRAAINCMAVEGHADHTIARATGLSVDYVRRLLSETTNHQTFRLTR
jgi:hypothetical protein